MAAYPVILGKVYVVKVFGGSVSVLAPNGAAAIAYILKGLL